MLRNGKFVFVDNGARGIEQEIERLVEEVSTSLQVLVSGYPEDIGPWNNSHSKMLLTTLKYEDVYIAMAKRMAFSQIWCCAYEHPRKDNDYHVTRMSNLKKSNYEAVRERRYQALPDRQIVNYRINSPYDTVIRLIEDYLSKKALPEDEDLRKRVIDESESFLINDRDQLCKKLSDTGEPVPYIDPLFRGDLMEHLHQEFGHLSYSGISNAIETRAWWPGMKADLKQFIAACPNCQIMQRQRSG